MSTDPEIEWGDIEKALQQLAGIVNQSADGSSDPKVRAFMQNLVIEMKDNTQRFGAALAQCNDARDAERDSARKFANDLQKEGEAILQQAEAMSAACQPVDAPPSVELEANPGPRLCRELLERYGYDTACLSDHRIIGWETWIGETSSAISQSGSAATSKSLDQAKEEWEKLLERSRSDEPSSPAVGKDVPQKEGWSTWLDRFSGNS